MALAINFNNFDLKSMKTLAPRIGNENNNNIRLRSRKCLFGPTNQEETYQMVKENFDQERERFYQRFGIHMEELDRFTIDEDEFKRLKYQNQRVAMPAPSSVPASLASASTGGGKIVSKKTIRMKRALKPYNANNQQASNQAQQQMKITDFCQVKKSPTSCALPIDAKKLQQQNSL